MVKFNTNSTTQNRLTNYKAVPQGKKEKFYNCYIRSVHTVSYCKFCCRLQGNTESVGAEWQVRRGHRADWRRNKTWLEQTCDTLAERRRHRCVQWVLQHQATNWFAGRGGNYPCIMSTAWALVHTGVWGKFNADNYLFMHLKRSHAHTQTHTHIQLAISTNQGTQFTITSKC